ncbi:MAG TPA: DUF421 domain-containing protein [Symbiobacteriaceae bacterium]|nr:DUF421 domain-containing protein [Symbiobacteriaceae bacterium]
MLWLRALVVYPLTIFLFRLIGRSLQFHSRPYDIAVQVLIGSAAAALIFDTEIPLWKAFTSLGTLVLMHSVLAFVSLWHPVKNFLVGQPQVLVENGRVLKANLILNQIAVEELVAALREKGFPELADVEFALLEASGKLSVIPKSQARPLTPRDLDLQTDYEGLATLIISDGIVDAANLHKVNLDEAWLQSQLAKRGVSDPREVLFASLDTQGELFVVRNQDVPFLQSIFKGVQTQVPPGLPPHAGQYH